MICPICSKENWATARFCQECGTFILGRCPQCRHEIPATARFCIHCGIALLSQEHNKTGAVTDDLSLHTVKSSAQAQPLQQYMPDELAIKLDSARSNQTMVGERRVVTMLFCDVKGSTAAAEQLDPEEWTEIMNGAFEQMIRPVYQYEGTIASLMGDAILAFFGAPIAHEDDPQRAVLAGLAIAEGINPYRAEIQKRWGIDIDVRVGINTGLVVAGGVGSDMKMEYTALGDAVNVAARMEQTAEPGTVHVSEDTYKLIAPLFEFEDLGLTEVKGKKDPLPTYRVIGRKLRAGRLRGIEGLQAPLIGRQIEWKQLNEALESLAKGIGQIAILNGEAGLGKSRLISELRLEAASVDSSIEWFETTCFSYESTQPYGLFQRLARRVVGAGLNDSPEVLRAKLEEAVAETVIDLTPTYRTQIFQMFETLFGLPGQDDLPPLQGESFKGMLYSLMTELWQHRSQANPLVIVCDDLHWADPASVALLEHLFALTENSPILFLCATRPERESPVWELRRHAADIYTHRTILIELKPLSASDSSILVDTLLDISDLPAEIRTRILLKADGNPFYVEEVVRTLIETGSVLHDAGGLHWQMTNNNGTIDIPDNLLALLTARMDRLDEESRRVLQLAALIGRSFYYRVLERVAVFLEDNDSGFRLVSSLNQLQQMNMIRETAKIPELEYMFHHPLTQEAAYNTILLKRRRAYHRAVADAIVGLYGDRLEEFAPVLGYHFEGAGDAAQAISYYTHAGDTAMRLFAKVEAIEHYSNALTLVASHPQTDTDQLAHLYLRYGRALELNGQFADALANYQEMETLAGENRDQHLRLDSWVAQMIILSTPTDQTDEVLAKQFGSRALPLAQQLGDRKAEARIYWATMNMHRFNNADEAIEIGEKGLLLARELGDSELLAYTLNDIGYSYRSTGRLQHTIEALSEAIELWRGLNNLPMLSDSLTTLAHQHIFQAEFERAFELCNEAYTVSEAINNRWGMSYSRYLVGDIHWRQGHISTAIATMEQAIADGDSRWRSSRFRRGAHQCES